MGLSIPSPSLFSLFHLEPKHQLKIEFKKSPKESETFVRNKLVEISTVVVFYQHRQRENKTGLCSFDGSDLASFGQSNITKFFFSSCTKNDWTDAAATFGRTTFLPKNMPLLPRGVWFLDHFNVGSAENRTRGATFAFPQNNVAPESHCGRRRLLNSLSAPTCPGVIKLILRHKLNFTHLSCTHCNHLPPGSILLHHSERVIGCLK